MNLDGTIPTDNPFYDGAGPNVDEIWAYGFRNPFRASFDETTGRYWIGDVGGNVAAQAYEEINIGERGKNYGWPTCEGPLGQPEERAGVPRRGDGSGLQLRPHHAYGVLPEQGGRRRRGLSRVDVPAGRLVHLRRLPDEPVLLAATRRRRTHGHGRRCAAGEVGIDTGLAECGAGWRDLLPEPGLRRHRPAAEADLLGLDRSATGDLHGIRLAYERHRPAHGELHGSGQRPGRHTGDVSWDFGDGTSATTANASHTYSKAGSYQATLRVTSNGVTTSSNTISITVGTPPTATITAPADGTLFSAGDTLTFTGTGNDPGVGTLPASALSWTIDFLHDDHAHPATSGTGASISYTVPMDGHDHDFNGNTRYRVTLTATDADGLTGTKVIKVLPRKTTVNITSNAATSLTVDGVTKNLPFNIDTLLGFQHELAVPATVCVSGTTRKFSSWSDGGARTHTITVTANMRLVATYTNTGTACTGGAATAPLVAPLSDGADADTDGDPSPTAHRSPPRSSTG